MVQRRATRGLETAGRALEPAGRPPGGEGGTDGWTDRKNGENSTVVVL